MSVKGNSSKEHLVAPVQSTGDIHKDLKTKLPDTYTGERTKLRHFWLQVELFLGFNDKKYQSEQQKVLWIVTLFEGPALSWIEGFLQDYLNYQHMPDGGRHMKVETRELFINPMGLKKGMIRVFGDQDEAKEAVKVIQTIRQKGSAARYTADFQKNAVKTGWNDASLKDQYYRGLKDAVKDDLAREEKPDTLRELVDTAIAIDNRHYERAQERRGVYDFQRGDSRGNFRRQRNTYRGDPMELDATERRPLSPQDRQKHMQDRTCFSCGKPGHMARNCRSGGRNPGRGGFQRGSQRRGELNAATRRNPTQGRGGYNGPMQLCATLRTPSKRDEEGTTTDFESMTLSETDDEWANDTPTSDSDQEDHGPVTRTHKMRSYEEDPVDLPLEEFMNMTTNASKASTEAILEQEDAEDILEELTEEELLQHYILSGLKTARELEKEFTDEWQQKEITAWEELTDNQPDEEAILKYQQDTLDRMVEYKFRLYVLREAIQTQIKEATAVPTPHSTRSQQYRDKLVSNIDFQEELDAVLRYLSKQKEQLKERIRTLRETENVARIDHPRHAELTWSACYTDSCSVHYSSKIDTGRFPQRRIPVYWSKDAKKHVSDSIPESSTKPSKN
jgi:Zinc knuckle/Retrotransposon gag protein